MEDTIRQQWAEAFQEAQEKDPEWVEAKHKHRGTSLEPHSYVGPCTCWGCMYGDW